MIKQKEKFEVFKDKDGNYSRVEGKDYQKVELYVVRPDYKTQQKASHVYAKAFREFVEEGALVRTQLNDILRERKLWNDTKQKEYDKLNDKIRENLLKLKKGKIRLKEAAEIAKSVVKDRGEILQLTLDRTDLDKNTAEAQADQVRFNYLVSACTVYDDKKPFFSSFEDYNIQDQLANPVVDLAGAAFWRLTTGLQDDVRKEWPEYKFLSKYKFVNDKLQFIKIVEGKELLVDMEGRLIDENNRYITADGKFCDRDGNLVDLSGELETESGDFLDDNDQPIKDVVETPEVVEIAETPKKRSKVLV